MYGTFVFLWLPNLRQLTKCYLRQIAHDPENYHDPMAFKPERFLEVDGRMPELDSRNYAFGFGRR